MKIKKNAIVFLGVIVVVIIGFLFISGQKVEKLNAPPISNDNLVFVENPIKNNATQAGFKIAEALVENNLDPMTQKPTNDHLEMTLQNISGKDLSNFEIYYTIFDPTANKKEGYYKKLTGFVLKAGEKKTIHFDNGSGVGHFSENPNSIYKTNNDAKVFDIIVSTDGYKLENIQINKDPGGAEKAD